MTPEARLSTAPAETARHLAALRAAADDVLAREWAPGRLRDLLDAGVPAWAPVLWRRVCALGWPDVLVTLGAGGGGGTMADLCVLAEAIGAAVAPVPLVPAAVVAWCRRTPVRADAFGVPVNRPLEASVGGTCPSVTGADEFVAYGDVAGALLVLAVTPDGAAVLATVDPAADGVVRTPLQPLDRMPTAAVTLERVDLRPADVVDSGAPAVARWEEAQLRLTLGWAAELTGVAAAATAAAVDYATHRVAFGRPIGAFQSIKHRLVDHRAAVEVERALVVRAAAALDAGAADAPALTSLAAHWAIDSLRAVTEGSLQVFGGLGYTWEHDAHLYLRRAAVLTALLGDRARHRDVVASWLESRRP